MRILQPLSKQCLSIYSEIHESVELRDFDLGRRMFKLMPIMATGGMHVFREPNQAQYDNTVTDKHIRSLEYETCRIREEVLTKTQISSKPTKGLNCQIKTEDLGRLRRIMVVDDERDVTFLFKLILEDIHHDPNFSYKVDSFNDSLAAMENYQEGLYDLVIIDIVMPKMNGFKLCKELRKKDKKVKVCFLTAGEMYYGDYRRHVFPQVASDQIIRKPISNDDLVRTINEYFAT